MKIERSRSTRACVVCGESLNGKVVLHLKTLYGGYVACYVGLHVDCLPRFIAEAKSEIKNANPRYGIKLDDKVIGGLRVRQE